MTTLVHGYRTESLHMSRQLSRSYVLNLSCDHFNQLCSAKGKIDHAIILPHEAKWHCQLANDDHPKNLFANKIHHLGCVIKRVSPKWLHNEDKKTLENSSRKLKKNSYCKSTWKRYNDIHRFCLTLAKIPQPFETSFFIWVMCGSQ